MAKQFSDYVEGNGDVCRGGNVVKDERAFESAQKRLKGRKQFVERIRNGRASDDGVRAGVEIVVGNGDVFEVAEASIDFGAVFDASNGAFDEATAERLRYGDRKSTRLNSSHRT